MSRIERPASRILKNALIRRPSVAQKKRRHEADADEPDDLYKGTRCGGKMMSTPEAGTLAQFT